MKVGDLVCLSRSVPGHNTVGIIVEEVDEPRAMHNNVFKVYWIDGSMPKEVWDYDLKVISENR